MAVFAPHFPLPREEKWFLFVADPLTNEIISGIEHVSLIEAEYLGAQAAQVRFSPWCLHGTDSCSIEAAHL